MTQFSSSSVLLGVLAMGCSSSGLRHDGGEPSSTGGVPSGGSTATGGAIVGGTIPAGGSDHGSTSSSSAGTTYSGGAQASGGISNIGSSAQSGGGISNIGSTNQSGGFGDGGTASSSTRTTSNVGTQAGGVGGLPAAGGTFATGGTVGTGGVTGAVGMLTSGAITSASGGIPTADAGGGQAIGGASTTTAPVAGCGDGILDATEQCDDANQASEDGCSSMCQVETGWQCRKAGQHCVPICGDSKKVGTETCDDGNKDNTDGCSSTCLTEPGYACTGTGNGSCRQFICGDGYVHPGEACDCGDDPKFLPVGCKGPNGVFFGDASGCSKTCTKEPTCTRNDTAGCASVCGDGNVSAGEVCDDGNTFDGDGCAGDCSRNEDGFQCENVTMSDERDCPSNPSLKCLVLPVIYRDFEGQNVTGGHPDFFYMGAAVTAGRTVGVTGGANKTTCVPNAYGTALAFTNGDPCRANDQSGPCTGLVADTLDSEGKPVMAKQKCHCIFTDWDNTGVLGTCSGPSCTPASGLSGARTCFVDGSGDAHVRLEGESSQKRLMRAGAARVNEQHPAPPYL